MTGSPGRSGGNRQYGEDNTREDGGPSMPLALSDKARTKWAEIMTQLPVHELRRIDCHQLGILCGLLVEADTLLSMLQDNPADHRTRRLHSATVQHIARLSAVFGLSVGDRKRIKLEPEPEIDELEEFNRS